MINEYTPVKQPYIQDVALPTVGDAFAKSRKRRRKTIPVQYLASHRSFTRVPPMAMLHESRLPQYKSNIKDPAPTMRSFVSFLPKKYDAAKGLVTDWHATTFSDMKFVAPILACCYGLMLLALAWQPHAFPGYKSSHYVKRTIPAPTDTSQSVSSPSVVAQPEPTSAAIPYNNAAMAAQAVSGEPVSLPVAVPQLSSDGILPATNASPVEDPLAPILVETPIVDVTVGNVPTLNVGANE